VIANAGWNDEMSGSSSLWRAILIVDHGSRDETVQHALARLADRVAEARPGWIVEHAHMELAEPGFDAGIENLVARGAKHIDVHLNFLSAGYHVRVTIPQLVAKARERHPTIPIEISEPLGHDPRIVDLIVDRMDAQFGANQGATLRRPIKGHIS
jgi:sirohydrochlorin ferrochelatase